MLGSGEALLTAGVEQAGAERRIQRSDGVATVLGAHRGGDPQQLQPRGVPVLVLAGKWVA